MAINPIPQSKIREKVKKKQEIKWGEINGLWRKQDKNKQEKRP